MIPSGNPNALEANRPGLAQGGGVWRGSVPRAFTGHAAGPTQRTSAQSSRGTGCLGHPEPCRREGTPPQQSQPDPEQLWALQVGPEGPHRAETMSPTDKSRRGHPANLWVTPWKCVNGKCLSCSCVQHFVTPMNCSPPGSSVRGILRARILEWAVIPFSRGSSQPRY